MLAEIETAVRGFTRYARPAPRFVHAAPAPKAPKRIVDTTPATAQAPAPTSIPRVAMARILAHEASAAERALSLGEHLRPWVLISEDGSAVVSRVAVGLKLETITSGLVGAYRKDEATARERAQWWNAQLTSEQVQAGMTVTAVHERIVFTSIVRAARVALQGYMLNSNLLRDRRTSTHDEFISA